jgi:GTP-binding protein YchF
MIKVGIVGLPNVGKSTLFNALTAVGVPSENYPFCTVDPNIGTVELPDPRLDHIHELMESAECVPTVIQFVDIAGLVEGASEGEGLGNRFLQNIREVDAIAHVLRCFDDPDITHVLGDVDSVRDRAIVETELELADLETVERRLERVEKKAHSGEKEALKEQSVLRKVQEVLGRGEPVRHVELDEGERKILKGFQLLTAKPVLYVANVAEEHLPEGENDWTRALREVVAEETEEEVVTICSAIQAELAELDQEHQREFLAEMGLEESGLDQLIHAAYHLLGLITFFTTGEKQTRAWTVRRGATAPAAAGLIHTDFQRGFIRAETIHHDEFVAAGTWKDARDRGLIRSEGKEYVVKDGDIMLFRFNV